jgi:hypothetical protein
MTASNHGQEHARYEVITQENSEGDMIIPLPMPLLKQLGWKEGCLLYTSDAADD